VARCVRWAERRTTTTSVHVIKATFAWATAKPPLPAPRLWIFRRQPFLGAPRQLLIVTADPKHFALRIRIGELLGNGAGFLGTLAPMLGVVDWDFGHEFTHYRRRAS
jgi:hypothetical protein